MTAIVVDRLIVTWTVVVLIAASCVAGYGSGWLWLRTSPVGVMVEAMR